MKPLERAAFPPLTKAFIQETARTSNRPYAEVKAALMAERTGSTVWLNDLYQVMVTTEVETGVTHLCIRRRDGAAIFRDWRHFQAIKDQLTSPDREGVEIYPATSRLVDTSNKYHIYVLPTGNYVPFGYAERDVDYAGGTLPGHRQRPLEETLITGEKQS